MKLTADKLKEIIRFFQNRKVDPKLTLKGKKSELQQKVKDLLTKYDYIVQERAL